MTLRLVRLNLLAGILLLSGGLYTVQGQSWLVGGSNTNNDRFASEEGKIKARNVSGLALKWTYITHGDVSATPTVDNGVAYVVDWGGGVHAVDTKTGSAIWSIKLSSITGSEPSYSRTSPAISGNLIILGDQGDVDKDSGFPTFTNFKTASVIALNKNTGALVWKTAVSPHLFSAVTSSPVVAGNTVYVGLSSLEEIAGFIPGYVFSFRGKVVALNANTGAIIWESYMVPPGYTGAAVWGNTPVVDAKRGSLYVATGNNYTVPAAVEAQIAADPANGESFLAADDYLDAVVALDLKTGRVKWGKRLQGADTWHVFRSFTPPEVDPGQGPDYDFASGPNLFKTKVQGKAVELLGAGQKSGIYWALNPDNGQVVWSSPVGPGGLAGGIQWGSATDGKRIYVALANNNGKDYVGLDGVTRNAGFWAGIDAATGNYLWQRPDPNNGKDYGMVTVANDVVFAGSTTGHMYAMDASSGQILWTYDSGGSVLGGPSVVDGTVYWGSGYARFSGAFGTGNNKLYAFYLP